MQATHTPACSPVLAGYLAPQQPVAAGPSKPSAVITDTHTRLRRPRPPAPLCHLHSAARAHHPRTTPPPLPAGNPCYVYIAKQVRDDPEGIPEALDACRAAKRVRLTPQEGEEVGLAARGCS